MVISAGKWGKHKTVWQIVAIVILLIGLSYRYDFLRGASADALESFDFIFSYGAHALAAGFALITVASGYLYFAQHRDLMSRR